MTVAVVFAGLAGGLILVRRGFETTLLVVLGVLPFMAWLQSHIPGPPWTIVPSALLALLAYQAVAERPEPVRPGSPPVLRRPAYGLCAVALAYFAVAAAQAFSSDLPSVIIGLRGLRLIVEPMVLFFAGAEVARRPHLRRRLVGVVIATGAVVVAYAFKQWLGGFDAAERVFYRHTFPIALRERRISSTLLGATALGNYAAVVAFLGAARMLAARRARPSLVVLCGASLFAVFLTGQRGVQLAVVAAVLAVVAVSLLRPGTRKAAARAGQALTVVFALVLAVAIATPIQDRRAARADGRSAVDAARIKLALLKQGSSETSFQLRQDRLHEVGDALSTAPFGAGTGLNLLLDADRSARSTFLGKAGFGDSDYQPRLAPIPGELYYYNLASELGLPGLVLFCGLALFGIVTAGGIAMRHPDREKAAFAAAALGIFLVIVVDSLTVDTMTTMSVAAYFWLLLGVVGRWGQEDRVPAARTRPARVRGPLAGAPA